ncbi:MAG: peptide chain release factor N(5)-glutamine methyltransferase [Gammaproteobacteria bacterium]|nr:peptide chain release factor N(5)-glutamine methyltransferase [Gammaproteobacteria bacterium]
MSGNPTTIGECLTRARRDLPRLEADVLTAHALNTARSVLYAFPERPVASDAASRHAQWVSRRGAGEPVAYIIAEREFWSLPLKVTADVLIPRPDTEVLVSAALERMQRRQRKVSVADLGTGSGAVALAIKKERPAACVVALDVDQRCVELAITNGAMLDLDIDVRLSDWFQNLEGRFDLIVSNPPYVADNDPHLGRGDVAFEPRRALLGGPDGLDALRLIVTGAPGYLRGGGWLGVEHGYQQHRAVTTMFASRGFTNVATLRDTSGHARVTVGQHTGAR